MIPENAQKFFFVGVLAVSILLSQGSFGSETSGEKILGSSAERAAPSAEKRTASAQSVLQGNDELPAVTSNGAMLPVGNQEIPVRRFGSELSELEPSESGAYAYGSGGELPESGVLAALGARAALVADVVKGTEYFSSRGDFRWPLASLTKLMTAAVALTHIDIAVAKGSLPDGSEYRARDLLKIMLLASNNDAAEALAGIYGRGRFIDEMNAQAESWNMAATHFTDPSGLSSSNQSTAHDLKLLVSHIYREYPEIFQTTRHQSAAVTDIAAQMPRTVASNNEFAGDADFLGGKTGYTEDAVGNLLSLFSLEGKPIMIIVLGTPDRFGETKLLLAWAANILKHNAISRP